MYWLLTYNQLSVCFKTLREISIFLHISYWKIKCIRNGSCDGYDHISISHISDIQSIKYTIVTDNRERIEDYVYLDGTDDESSSDDNEDEYEKKIKKHIRYIFKCIAKESKRYA